MKTLLLFIACTLLYTGSFSQAFTSGSFQPKKDVTTGVYPHFVVLADFNGDGKTDVFVSRGSSSFNTVFTNTSSNGNISLGPALDLPANGNFSHEGTVVGDLDGDGKLDVVVTNGDNAGSISIYRNTSSTGGIISFAARIDSPALNGPYSVAIGDLDGDGKPDLAIANGGINKISILRNTSTPGHISFDTRVDLGGMTNPYGIAIGDLDGDGKADLAITCQGTNQILLVMKNNSVTGALSFAQPVQYATLSAPFTVAIGDLDGDGKPDIAAASAGSNTVTVVRNTGTPGNMSFAAQVEIAAGTYPVSVSIVDLDGDGKKDIVTANRFDYTVSAIRNTSTPGSLAFDAPVNYAVGADPLYGAVGDLDGDGRPDIVSANSSAPTISILRNLIGLNVVPAISSFAPMTGSNGTAVTISGSNFTGVTAVSFGGIPASSFTINSATSITAIVGPGASGNVSVTNTYGTANLSGFNYSGPIIAAFTPAIGVEGTQVVITGSNFTGATAVSFGGTPASSFTVSSPTSITATVGKGSSGDVTVVTANGSAVLPGFAFGAPAILSFSPLSGGVGATVTITGKNFDPVYTANTVFFGAVRATVTSATATQLTVTVPAGAAYQPISVTTHHLTAYSSRPFILTWPGNNKTLTNSSFVLAGNFQTGGWPRPLLTADLDGDGKPDVVVGNQNGNSISVFHNRSVIGSVALDPRIDVATGPAPIATAAGDLDGDGKPDLVVLNFDNGQGSTISLLRNTSVPGTISFDPKADYPAFNGSTGIAIADMNGDGKPDIIVASGNSFLVSIFPNTTTTPGVITLGAPVSLSYPMYHPDGVVVADLDGDGRPDLVVTDFGHNSMYVFPNASTGGKLSMGFGVSYAVGSNPSWVSAADLDGDGLLDLALGNYTSQSVSLFKNMSSPGNIALGARVDSSWYSTVAAFADLNGDGKIDLCIGRWNTGNASIFENTSGGVGAFAFGSPIDYTTGNFDAFVNVGDLDGDGKPDIIVANTTAGTISVLRNRVGDPVITSLSGNSGGKGSLLTLTGQNFTGATSVTIGGVPAASFRVISSSSIEATVGEGASGDVAVTTPMGMGSFAGFNFVPEINAGEPLTFCKGGSVLLSSTAAAGNQWYKDSVAIPGATDRTFSADSGGVYTVKTTSNSITTTSAGVRVTVISLPRPVITQGANYTLMSSDTAGNQWYFNGKPIPGARGRYYQPVENGSYTVTGFSSGCTSDPSLPFEFRFTGVIDLGNNLFINLYPNPVQKDLHIYWNTSDLAGLKLAISNMQGKQVLVIENTGNGAAIDLSGLPKGMYFVRVLGGGGGGQLKVDRTVKIVKTN